MAVVHSLSSSSKVDVWTIGSRMKKSKEIAGSRVVPLTDFADGSTISSSRKGSGCVLPFPFITSAQLIENWIAIQKFPARTAQRRYREAAEEIR